VTDKYNINPLKRQDEKTKIHHFFSHRLLHHLSQEKAFHLLVWACAHLRLNRQPFENWYSWFSLTGPAVILENDDF
jgi:hypothetical protein